jgi:endonuclease/exonuclease/phosphatase (EEP) superfamily protein YafD
VVTALVALAVGLRWLDTSAARVPVAQAAFPMVGAGAVAWAVIALAVHRRRVLWALPAVCVALVPVTLAASAGRAATVVPSTQDEVVAASNLEFGEAEPVALVTQLRSLDVDTLVLTEVTPDAAARLDDAGLARFLPHEVGSAQPGADGTVIFSRHRLTEVSADHLPGLFDQPVATVHAPSGDYVLRAMHPYPPTSRLVRAWHRQLDEAATWVAGQSNETPLVLAGDFNASHAHPSFRRLADGLVDAHRAAGSGWVRTWPQGRRVPAFVQLDHVLVRDGEVADAGAAVVAGTDHALVWARLQLG